MAQLDPALEWLGQMYLGPYTSYPDVQELQKAIKQCLLADVRKLVRTARQDNPPFHPEYIARLRKVQQVIEAPLSYRDALLVPVEGGFVIKLNRDLHPFQRRFACAHEIGHTFFYDLTKDPPRRQYRREGARYWREEGYACEIAREILMPSDSVVKIVSGRHLSMPSIVSLRELSGIYQVSYDPLRIRLIDDLRVWQCVVFRSTVDGRVVKTLSRDVSKGSEYRCVEIPHVLSPGTRGYSTLYSAIMSTVEEGRRQQRVLIRKRTYELDSVLLDDAARACLTMVRRIGTG